MALPQQLKAARADNSTAAATIDNVVGALETALANIFGFTLDVDVTASPFTLDNSGRITKALVAQRAAGPVGLRFRDTTSGKEVLICVRGTNLDIDENTNTEATPTWTNRFRMAIATGVMTGAAADTSNMGLCPQGDGNATHFLNGTVAWTAPAGAGANPACRVRNSANVSISSGSYTEISMDTEDFDTDTMHSNGTQPSHVTCVTAGKYLAIAQVSFAANDVGTRAVYVRKNGTDYMARVTVPAVPDGAPTRIEARTILDLGVGDYIELVAYQSSGGALNVEGGSAATPVLSAVKVS